MNKDKYGIYSIVSNVDNKVYIGQTMVGFDKRWKKHISALNKKRHSNNHLQNAWNKYGEANFSFNVLEICTKDNINEAEIFWIYTLKTLNREYGYNIRFGGSNGKLSNETKLKLSIANSGENNANYGKTGELSHSFGIKRSVETRAKISKGRMGMKFSKEHINNMKLAGKMREKMTDETRAKISKSNIGKHYHNLGKTLTDDVKAKISQSLSGENHYNFGKSGVNNHSFGKKNKRNTSGYIGVSLNKLTSRYRVSILLNGKRKSLGTFDNAIDAAKRYDEESYKVFNRIDILNFPEDYINHAI